MMCYRTGLLNVERTYVDELQLWQSCWEADLQLRAFWSRLTMNFSLKPAFCLIHKAVAQRSS